MDTLIGVLVVILPPLLLRERLVIKKGHSSSKLGRFAQDSAARRS
jgi:hypothetical protein